MVVAQLRVTLYLCFVCLDDIIMRVIVTDFWFICLYIFWHELVIFINICGLDNLCNLKYLLYICSLCALFGHNYLYSLSYSIQCGEV
jgi:hypothetical protein